MRTILAATLLSVLLIGSVNAQQRIGAAIAQAKLTGELVESLDTELMAQILYRIIDHACLEFIVRSELTVDEMAAQVVGQLEMLIRPYLRH